MHDDHGASHHGHHHAHDEAHIHLPVSGNILFALVLNVFFALIEIVGGIWTNSLAVLSDALHDAGDSFTLLLALILEKVSRRKRDRLFSYGYRRFSLLAAFITGVVILAGSAFILYESIERFRNPEKINAPGVIMLSVLGIVFNGLGALRLRKGASVSESFLAWHLIEDVLGWSAILIGALVLYFTGFPFIDPLLSTFFALFTFYNVYKLFKRTVLIFLQSVPQAIDIAAIESGISSLGGVRSIHDTHVWTLDGQYHIFTTHVVVEDRLNEGEIATLKSGVRDIAFQNHIEHATIEIEREYEMCGLKNC